MSVSFFFGVQRVEDRLGFCDLDLVAAVKKIPSLNALVKILSDLGFSYCGDTKSDSKAYTNMRKKRIFIGRNKTLSEACLSLMYELTNAKNATKANKIHSRYFPDKQPTEEKAVEYARAILLIEAEAIFNRSTLAIELGIESLVKNRKYIEILHRTQDHALAIHEIFIEMVETGMVHNGKKKAIDHYVSQYFNNCNAKVKKF